MNAANSPKDNVNSFYALVDASHIPPWYIVCSVQENSIMTCALLPLVGTDDLRIHSRQVIVDVVLLLVGISLDASQ